MSATLMAWIGFAVVATIILRGFFRSKPMPPSERSKYFTGADI